MIVREIARLLEPWKNLYANSTVISTAVLGAHILALLVSGGLAIAADRTTLRATRTEPGSRRVLLDELRDVHRPVLIGMVVLFVTGLLLMASDFETYAVSLIFWVKMGLIAGLLFNGAMLYRAEHRLERETEGLENPPPEFYRRLRGFTWLSLALWIVITIGGSILPAVA